MLPLPRPQLNGFTLEHAELRALHRTMREAIHTATSERALDGPRQLFPERGEGYTLRAHGRDRDGNLLASVTIRLPWSGSSYVRKVRMCNPATLKCDFR